MKNLKWADFLLSSELNQKFSNYRKDLKILVTQNTADKWNTTVSIMPIVNLEQIRQVDRDFSKNNSINEKNFEILKNL